MSKADLDKLKNLIRDCVKEEFADTSLNESLRVSEMVMICGGKQVPFGSKEHIDDLQRTLEGLEVLKNSWLKGSTSRYMVSSACARVKKLIKKLMQKQLELSSDEEEPSL